MIGQLVELKNASQVEQFGVIKAELPSGKFRVATSWFGLSGGLSTERIVSKNEINFLTPTEIFIRQQDIQQHFERIWAVNNARRATTKTLRFSQTEPDGAAAAEIGFLPPAVSDRLVDHFLSEGWFAYDY